MTDLEHTNQVNELGHDKEVEWSEKVGKFIDGPEIEEGLRIGEFCLEITLNRANLKWKPCGQDDYSVLSSQEILELVEKYDSGLLQIDNGQTFYGLHTLTIGEKLEPRKFVGIRAAGRFLMSYSEDHH